MRKILFHLGIQVCIYFLFLFISFDTQWHLDDSYRIGYVLISLIIQILTIFIYVEIPNWLQTPTHEEKKTGIKKYIGELHEELALYAEAMELQKKVREFKSKQ